MQQGRSALNSFPESIDLNQGSLPDNTSMDHSASWNNMLNPVGTDRNVACIDAANETAQSFSGWDHGESSTGTNNTQDGACGGDSKMRLGWSSSLNACSGLDARSEDWSFEPSSISTSYSGNLVTGGSLNMQNYSNHGSLNLNLNHGNSWGHDCHSGYGAGLPHNIGKSDHLEMDHVPNIGTLSGSSDAYSENYDATGPTLGSWGSSCKRKSLEGTSGQFYPGGSSSSHQPRENVVQHPVPGCYSASGTLSISSGPLNLSPINHVERLNPSGGVGMSRVLFPSSTVSAVAETSARTSTVRLNHGRHESVSFDTPRGTSVRNSGVYAGQLSRPITNIDASELRSPSMLPINQNITLNHSHLIHSNEARGTHSYPWNGSFNSRGGSSSSSFMISGERGSGAHEEVIARSSRLNDIGYPMTVSAPETRNILHDQIDWSFAPGSPACSRNHPSGSRSCASAGGRTYSGSWLSHQNQTLQNHQSLSESLTWFPSNRVESDSGIRRSHFSLLPSASSSSDGAASTSHTHHQLDQRFFMDMPDVNGWRALAGFEGRHRLIRQVLNAMQRGVHLQTEDYMLNDPFINGFAELHDRHRDMRLDVDNMSYEELLALEDRIGSVSTGLSEEKITETMTQRKHEAMGGVPNSEPCCICQEDYITGDDIGILDCEHEFHTNCVKQWLMLKNLCPICKMTALET